MPQTYGPPKSEMPSLTAFYANLDKLPEKLDQQQMVSLAVARLRRVILNLTPDQISELLVEPMEAAGYPITLSQDPASDLLNQANLYGMLKHNIPESVEKKDLTELGEENPGENAPEIIEAILAQPISLLSERE